MMTSHYNCTACSKYTVHATIVARSFQVPSRPSVRPSHRPSSLYEYEFIQYSYRVREGKIIHTPSFTIRTIRSPYCSRSAASMLRELVQLSNDFSRDKQMNGWGRTLVDSPG